MAHKKSKPQSGTLFQETGAVVTSLPGPSAGLLYFTPSSPASPYLNAKEAAAYLRRKDPRTLINQARLGTLKYKMIGREYFFKQEWLDR